MTKRSQKRSPQNGDQANCMWGFISMFGFRQNPSSIKLISDKRRYSKQAAGARSTTKKKPRTQSEKCEAVSEERVMAIADILKTNEMELTEGKALNMQASMKQFNDSVTGLVQVDTKNEHQSPQNLLQSQSAKMEISALVAEIVTSKQGDSGQFHKRSSSSVLDSELVWISQKNGNCIEHKFYDDLESSAAQAVPVEEKIVEAVKMFIDARTSDRKNDDVAEKLLHSKEFMDAMRTLVSDNGLLLKLLQDSNSSPMKQMQNLENAQFEEDDKLVSLSGSNLPELKQVILKSDGSGIKKHYKSCGRRSKSLDSFLSYQRDEDLSSSSETVCSKYEPAGLQSSDTASNVPLNLNKSNTSPFSFTAIKRKLRNAMGKESEGMNSYDLLHKFSSKQPNENKNDDEDAIVENFSWSSPNRNRFYSEKFLKSPVFFKGCEQDGKSKDEGSHVLHEICRYPKLEVSNIYIEAKKYLSEILENERSNAQTTSIQLHKPLGKILSLPDYDNLPCCSPRKHVDEIFITSKLRSSPQGIVRDDVNGLVQENSTNLSSSDEEIFTNQRHSLDDKVQSLSVLDGHDQECISNHEATNPSSSLILLEIEEITESAAEQDGEIVSNTIKMDVQNGKLEEVDCQESPSQELNGLKMDLYGEDEAPSSPTSSPIHSSGNMEGKDSLGLYRPSPTSVLDPPFMGDDISPARTSSRGDKQIEPRRLNFEEQSPASEQGTLMRFSLDDEESAFEYAEAVLLCSGLNWDEFLLRWLSFVDILDPSLFDEVELFSSRSHHDQRLLFDCANEVLNEMCGSYFGFLTRMSFSPCHIHPVPMGMDLIQEVNKRVEQLLLLHHLPQSLDQLIKRDVAECGKWLNIQPDFELIEFDFAEAIFDDLVDDTILNYVNDMTSFCKHSIFQYYMSTEEH